MERALKFAVVGPYIIRAIYLITHNKSINQSTIHCIFIFNYALKPAHLPISVNHESKNELNNQSIIN
jgi:hypothetical protein